MYALNVEQFSNKIFQGTNRFWLVPFLYHFLQKYACPADPLPC